MIGSHRLLKSSDFLDCRAYEDYCRSHPDYKNNRCICAVANIKRVYNERLQKHDFS